MIDSIVSNNKRNTIILLNITYTEIINQLGSLTSDTQVIWPSIDVKTFWGSEPQKENIIKAIEIYNILHFKNGQI